MNLGQLLGEKDLEIEKLKDKLRGKGIEPDAPRRVRELEAMLADEKRGRAADVGAHKDRESQLLARIAAMRDKPGNPPELPLPPVKPAPVPGMHQRKQPTRYNTKPRLLAMLKAAKKPMSMAQIRAKFPEIPGVNLSVAINDLQNNDEVGHEGKAGSYRYFAVQPGQTE